MTFGCIPEAHPLQGSSLWVIFADGSRKIVNGAASATWAFVVLERVGPVFQLAGMRSGKV
jgi:hypothetical protein